MHELKASGEYTMLFYYRDMSMKLKLYTLKQFFVISRISDHGKRGIYYRKIYAILEYDLKC